MTAPPSASAGEPASAGPPADLAELRDRQARRWPRAVLAFVAGLVLLAVAARVVVHERAALDAGFSAIAHAPAWMIAAALGLPLLNLVFASASFWVLTNRHGRVPMLEMLGLIGSAWLLNHLPLRPGMIGRVAYHKFVHGIPIRSSLAVLLSALICAATGMGILLALTVVLHAAGVGTAAWVAGLALPVAVGLAAAAWLRRSAALAARPHAWRYPAAVVFRYLDVCCWTARYALVFALLGRPIAADSAAALALSSQAAMLSPIQLGLREWMVGLAASIVARDPVASAAPTVQLALPHTVADLAPGLLADMINRAAELSVAIPVGLLATALLYRRFQRVRRAGPMADAPAAPAESADTGNGR